MLSLLGPLVFSLAACAPEGAEGAPGGGIATAKTLGTSGCVDDTDGDHTFRFCTTRVSWADAQAACAASGHHLADVEDAAEGAWIWGVAEGLEPDFGWWSGLNDAATEGAWAWDGGASTTYTDWRPGEPNDYAGAEDCGGFADNGAGAWNDKACSTTLPYVCEAGCLWSSWYADVDADGFGDPAALTRACDAPVDTVADATDCDDADPAVAPDGVEVCGGGDEDCDGAVDDADPSVSAASLTDWYADADSDGYGAGAAVSACVGPVGYVADNADCDDTDAAFAPGAPDRPADGVDQDCDGADGCTWYADTDGDSHGDPASPLEDCGAPVGYAASADDCDDADPAVYAGAVEVWYDGVDGDCSGGSDADADADGVDAADRGGADCDDTDATTFPGAEEACDAADDDCDGAVDSTAGVGACAVPVSTYDGHTYLFVTTRGSWDTARAACEGLGYHLVDVRDAAENEWIWAEAEAADATTGWWMGLSDGATEGAFVWEGGSPSAYTAWRPGEPNDYAGAEDCGAWADDGAAGWNDKNCVTHAVAYVCEAGCEPVPWYADTDADAHGDPTVAVSACVAPAGFVSAADDCDDADPTVSPDAPEVCDAADADEDCDGAVDGADPSVDPASYTVYYADADGDGYGDPSVTVGACDPVAGASAEGTDCDDTDEDVFPGATERENGHDDNCDGRAEFVDSDDDGLSDDDEVTIGTDPAQADSDGDGLWDGDEVPDPSAPPDADADGALDPLDADDDGDRLTTFAEIGAYDPTDPASLPDDVDGDSTPDHLDLDSDGDTVEDSREGLLDADRDGYSNAEDPDDDGDGLLTAVELAPDVPDRPAEDADADGTPNHLDLDSDDDGCPDGRAADGLSDADRDGLPAFVDPDECAPAEDTGAPDLDTGAPAEGPPGCGCAATPPAAAALTGMLAALLLVRRRR